MTREAHGLLTSSEVARAVGVGARTVNKWHSLGLLSGYRLPGGKGDRRFRRCDVIAFAAKHGMPLLLDGHDEPRRGGNVPVCSRDEALLDHLRHVGGFILHQSTCLAEFGYQVARLLPGLVVIDRGVVGYSEAIEAVDSLDRLLPACRVVLVLDEDDAGAGYHDGLSLLPRPFGASDVRAAITRDRSRRPCRHHP